MAGFPGLGHGGSIIGAHVGIAPVEPPGHAAAGGPKRKGAQIAGGVEIIRRVGALFTVEIVGAGGVQAGGIHFPGFPQQRCGEGSAVLLHLQLVAQRQGDKGGVVGQGAEDAAQLGPVIRLTFRRRERVHRVPVGQLRLHQHAQAVGGGEGGLRRAVAVEAHGVRPVAAVGQQHLLPGFLRHGLVPGFGKLAAVGFAAQEDGPAVQRQAAVLSAEIADAEGFRSLRFSEAGRQGVQVAFV